MRSPLLTGLAVILAGLTTPAQEIAGRVFEDLDGDGVQDAGEAGLKGIAVRAYGSPDAGGTFDQTVTTGIDGSFSFSPGAGCYLLRVQDPPGWRRTLGRYDERSQGAPEYPHPTGMRRYGGAPQLLENLASGAVRYTAMGDSIAWNWNSCFDTSSFWYSKQIRDRLRCVNGTANVTLDEEAVKGEHTDHLLEEDTTNNVFHTIGLRPEFVSISIIGNDLLNNEPGSNPTQEKINIVAEEMIDSRSNLQEILSSLVSELPRAEIELNTLYDNLGDDCSSEPFHVEWLPIANHIMRELAWGQTRRVSNAEIFAEFAHEDLSGGCTGFKHEICHTLGDDIHPRGSGYKIIREKLWEAIDGVNLGSRDGSGATSQLTAHHGYLRRIRRLLPTSYETRAGAKVTNPEAAFNDDDSGAGAVVTLGIGSEELRLSGFPTWYDELDISRVVAGIRYRTTGTVTDDFYRVEASVNGIFRPPAGHNYKPTDWNYYTPIVGSGGPNMPPLDPDHPNLRLLVVPNVTNFRTVSSTLTKNPVVSAGGSHYEWPSLTLDEIGTSVVRLVSAPVAATTGDAYQVIIDAVWLDIYGREKDRPAEIARLEVSTPAAGGLTLRFDELAGASSYNAYFGSLGVLAAEGRYDYGGENAPAKHCAMDTLPDGEGRRRAEIPPASVPAGNVYILVTGMADGVESPAGNDSAGHERDRSQNTCR